MNTRRRNPYWDRITHVDFVECPRCKAMAISMVADNNKPFGVICSKCGLHPAKISVWDDKCGTLLYCAPIIVATRHEMVQLAQSPACTCSVWEGDVLVARWVPKEGMTYYAGRCGE